MIDFEIPQETKAIREKVRAFVQAECIPAEEKIIDSHKKESKDVSETMDKR